MQIVLMDSFPSVKTVIDAPVQMACEVRLLEQTSAAASAGGSDPARR